MKNVLFCHHQASRSTSYIGIFSVFLYRITQQETSCKMLLKKRKEIFLSEISDARYETNKEGSYEYSRIRIKT